MFEVELLTRKTCLPVVTAAALRGTRRIAELKKARLLGGTAGPYEGQLTRSMTFTSSTDVKVKPAGWVI